MRICWIIKQLSCSILRNIPWFSQLGLRPRRLSIRWYSARFRRIIVGKFLYCSYIFYAVHSVHDFLSNLNRGSLKVSWCGACVLHLTEVMPINISYCKNLLSFKLSNHGQNFAPMSSEFHNHQSPFLQNCRFVSKFPLALGNISCLDNFAFQ